MESVIIPAIFGLMGIILGVILNEVFRRKNRIEGFWSQLKRSIDGTYHHVTAKHLPEYVDEYSFRYNHRNDERPMFQTMLAQVVRHASEVS